MSDITTKKLIEEYCNNPSNSYTTKESRWIWNTLESPKLYQYELKKNKLFVNFDKDEGIEIAKILIGNKKNNLSIKTLRVYELAFHCFVDWYSNNYYMVQNIWDDGLLVNNIRDQNKVFTKKKFEIIFKKIDSHYENDIAKYYKLILKLYYLGIRKSSEILDITSENIDIEKKEIYLDNRIIRLDFETIDLLKWNFNSAYIYVGNIGYNMLKYRGCAIKIPRRHEKNNDEFSLIEKKKTVNCINKVTNIKINKELKENIDVELIYGLGVYERWCKKYGKIYIDDLILAVIQVQLLCPPTRK